MYADRMILLFVKAPIRGQVKSRLAAALGIDIALELYRSFVLDTLKTVDSTGVPCGIFVHPPEAENAVTNWLGKERLYHAQQGKDVGERMEHAFRLAFSAGCSRAVLIGSDIPDLPKRVLTDAIDALGRNDAVIGLAEDGGYYLIGFRADSFLPGVFRDIPWSTAKVFALTMAVLERAGRTIHQAPRWRDVDTVHDLQDLASRNEKTDFKSSRTMAYLSSIRDLLPEAEDSHAAI